MSYIPNWYIGENNFFYTGLAACCVDADFEVLAGTPDLEVTTTSTTTPAQGPTTSSTTTQAPDCEIIGGEVLEVQCSFEGSGVITIPPSTTTTVCSRPSDLRTNILFYGYQFDTNAPVSFKGSAVDACKAITVLAPKDQAFIAIGSSVQSVDFLVGSDVYVGEGTDCTFLPDGYYLSYESLKTGIVFLVDGGTIVNIFSCSPIPGGTVSSTTTAEPPTPPIPPTVCYLITTSGVCTFGFFDNDLNRHSLTIEDESARICAKKGLIGGLCDTMDITVTGGTAPCTTTC